MWEPFVSLDAHNVVAQGRSMKPEERDGFLSQWVFPDRYAVAMRLDGDFAPSDTTGPTTSAQPRSAARAGGKARSTCARNRCPGKVSGKTRRVEEARAANSAGFQS